MGDKKATEDDDVLTLVGEDGLGIVTQLFSNIHETGEWYKDFTEVTLIALRKKPKATKCSNHHTISLIAHTVKIVRGIESTTEDVLGEDRLGFRRGTGMRNATEMLRIILE